MIQRIQTLYFLIADLIIAALYFLPCAAFADKNGKLYLFNLFGVIADGIGKGELVLQSWPLLVMTSLIVILLVLVIFRYKDRLQQTKLAYLILFLQISLTALIYFYIWKSNGILGGSYSLKISFTFPLISAVLVWLAIRGIAKDEQLVKSIDRIR